MRLLNHDIFLSFYGDDFTGSTDALDALTFNGIRTALFFNPPEKSEIFNFKLKQDLTKTGDKNLQAFGVAGISRSWNPDKMNKELPSIFKKIARADSDFFHYKVCSTFDSSPEIGSIGHAGEILYKYFKSPWIGLLVGAPALKRYCIFGNLFASVNDITYRIDRHPTMSRHPVTPMHESDLRRHLSLQTQRPVQLFDIFAMESNTNEQDIKFNNLTRKEGQYLLFDILYENHILEAGKILCTKKCNRNQLLIGSSGVEYALSSYLQNQNKIKKITNPESPGKVEPIVVVSGSCSPVTQEQIKWCLDNGFKGIQIDTKNIINIQNRKKIIRECIKKASEVLANKQSIIIYTALGPDDKLIQLTKKEIKKLQLSTDITSEIFGKSLGEILKELIISFKIKRVVVSGGDTAGYTVKALDINALEAIIPIATGAPLCIAHSSEPRFDGLQIALKGGQIGKISYFGEIAQGRKF